MSILWQTISAVFTGPQHAKRRANKQIQAGKFASAMLTCEEILRTEPQDTFALTILSEFAESVKAAVDLFQRAPDIASEDGLRHLRSEFVSLLQALPANSAFSIDCLPVAQAHSSLMHSGLRDLVRNNHEESAFGRLRTEMTKDRVVDASHLLALMLLGYSFELRVPIDFKLVPDSIKENYSLFLLDSPQVFQELGDAADYAEFLVKTIGIFHRESIVRHAINGSDEALKLTNISAIRARFMQAQFNTQNHRNLMEMRGDLISTALLSAGATILSALPPHERANEQIKLGVFTRAFSSHADEHFAASHFDHLDPRRFHITLYVLESTGSSFERHCISRVDNFVVLPTEDLGSQAERIRADDLDLLLFGMNQSTGTEASALLGGVRLARTQIATACSPITTGMRHIDVMLSAQVNEPAADAAQHYSEQLWRMPGALNVYADQYDMEPATINFSRADLNISEETIVFFSGANFFKIIPEVSLTWAKILAGVPNSVLVLMPFNPNWSTSYRVPPFVARIKQQFTKLGVSPDRLRIIDPVPTRADVHKVLATADVYLDAYPIAGRRSLLDSIIAGIPPVVRSGPVGRSVHGAALMRMTGAEEVICLSEESYIQTAIDLASNPARRAKIHTIFKELNARQPPPYFDTRAFSSKVGDALIAIHAQYLEPYRTLKADNHSERRRKLQSLADSVVGHSVELTAFVDFNIVESLVKPYFQQRKGERRLHMVDVGACYGMMSLPFLADGWSADLFEPDPSPRPTLERNVAKYGASCRVFASAVSNSADREVAFHQARDSLSGLGESPFWSTEAVLKVSCTRLADFYVEENVKFVDFLKIDAEGFDFDVLASHDFNAIQPPLLMVEFGTFFETESREVINQAIGQMAALGYGSVLINYDDDGKFSHGDFTFYRLTHFLIDQPLPDLDRVAFGNILFYRSDDVDFLLSLYSLLDVCRPRTKRASISTA